MALQADLRHVIYALSDALDLVGVDDVAHGKRVGIMAAECARQLHVSDDEVRFLFDLGLLHDIGVSSTETHRHLVGEFDWKGSQAHALVGAELLAGFAPLADMAEPIRYHHTRWDELQQRHLPHNTAQRANLILLVDRVDALASPYYADNTVLLHTDEIRAAIADRRGTYFDPQLVDAFLAASRSEAFWLLLEPRAVQGALQDMVSRGRSYLAGMEELRQLARLFSRIVDAKSPFTAEHSAGVARLARWLAIREGVPTEQCDRLEIAGLLHDLGKLRVPDAILEKPEGLSHAERLTMNAHSFETYQILRNIQGFEDIALWAAYHHEVLDGSGYPFHVGADALGLEARILRVADIFQALVQRRPYREPLSGEAALDMLRRLATQNKADTHIIDTLASDLSGAMAAALDPA